MEAMEFQTKKKSKHSYHKDVKCFVCKIRVLGNSFAGHLKHYHNKIKADVVQGVDWQFWDLCPENSGNEKNKVVKRKNKDLSKGKKKNAKIRR